jgi:hypothetical protein
VEDARDLVEGRGQDPSQPLVVDGEEEYSAPPAIVVGEERTQPRMQNARPRRSWSRRRLRRLRRRPRMHPPSRGIAPRPPRSS